MAADLREVAAMIIEDSQKLIARHADVGEVPVNYACIFSHTDAEYDELLKAAQAIGHAVKDTPTGSVFQIEALPTVAGPLQLLKIRKPDPTRTERGDADFTVPDYAAFKAQYLNQPGFSLIERPEMEMIELVDPAFDVRAYFSNPTLLELLDIA